MGFYTRTTLPALYALADNFTLCDHWFCSLLSSTWPNRKYLHSGCRDDDNDTQTLPPFPGFKTMPVWNVLEDQINPDGGGKNKMTWKCYFTDLPFLAFWYPFAAKHALSNFRPVLQFAEDCFADTLPAISIVEPAFSVADDHPAHNPRLGEKWLGLVIDALTNSDAWQHTALLLLYDENGGFYDHVPPPTAAVAKPKEIPEDDRLGFRVPAFVVSPYPVKGKAVKTVFDHTSLLKSISVRWNLKFDEKVFGSRWKTMPDIWESCFDFSQDPLPAGTYTGPPFKELNFAAGVYERLVGPQHDLRDLLERIFHLPELKSLDYRPQVYDSLAQLENRVISMKRMNDK
jgi:phospholipase C